MAELGPKTSCLIVEDQALIGMALEAYLEDAGFVPGLVSSGAQAMTWLDRATPDCVILDFELKDGPCTRLAAELRRRGVPFIVYSGHHRHDDDAELRDIQWIEKPAARDELLDAVRRAASGLSRVDRLEHL
jgi:DNA-binding response OmpR family regulator